jgi:hypothetical protein
LGHSGMWGHGRYGQPKGIQRDGMLSLFPDKGYKYFFSFKDKKNIIILGNLSQFGAQEMPNCSKIAFHSILTSLSIFPDYLLIMVEFLLKKRLF